MGQITLLDAAEMRRVEERLAAQILECHQAETILLAGIQRRGADLAARLCAIIAQKGATPLLGSLDINLYRDDWGRRGEAMPAVRQSSMPPNLDGKVVIVVDDVLFSGRTIRAALEAILDYGRPERVELLALIDRGHRELPISATYVGRVVTTEKDDDIAVLLKERDGEDGVFLRRKEAGKTAE